MNKINYEQLSKELLHHMLMTDDIATVHLLLNLGYNSQDLIELNFDEIIILEAYDKLLKNIKENDYNESN